MLMGLLNRTKGFTALEIIVALVLIAVLSIVSLAWYSDQNSAKLKARANILISHLRFAQMRSMNTNSSWGIEYNTENSNTGIEYNTENSNTYWLFKMGSTEKFVLPGETQNNVQLGSDGVSIDRAFRIFFDSWGQPFDSWGQPDSDSAFVEGKLSLNLKMDGQPDQVIQIVEYTGFIE
jgi:prepilin-type N-terminal cleavage/methylation domain-containing protein